MANLYIKLEQVEGEKQGTLTLRFTDEVGKEFVIEQMKRMFEMETLSAKTLTDKKGTTISILIECEEKLNQVRSLMVKTFRETSGLGNIYAN